MPPSAVLQNVASAATRSQRDRAARRLRSRAAPILLLCAGAVFSSIAQQARAQMLPAVDAPPAPGFTFCAAPFKPACVVKRGKTRGESCEERVKFYIASVFRYRECLEAEMERSVRESNDLLDIWRCRQKGARCR